MDDRSSVRPLFLFVVVVGVAGAILLSALDPLGSAFWLAAVVLLLVLVPAALALFGRLPGRFRKAS